MNDAVCMREVSMLVKKPKEFDKHEPHIPVPPEAFVHMHRADRWIEYHKARAELAIAALEEIQLNGVCVAWDKAELDGADCANRASKALAKLKENE